MDNLDLVPKSPAPDPSSTARKLLHCAQPKMSTTVPSVDFFIDKYNLTKHAPRSVVATAPGRMLAGARDTISVQWGLTQP